MGFSAPSVWEALGGQAQERVDRGADSSALGAGLRGQVGTWVWGPLCIPGGEINPFRFWKGWAWGVLEEGVSVGGNPGRLPKGGSQKGGGTANRHSQVMVNGMGLGTTEKPKEENQLCWHQTQASPRVHTRRGAGRACRTPVVLLASLASSPSRGGVPSPCCAPRCLCPRQGWGWGLHGCACKFTVSSWVGGNARRGCLGPGEPQVQVMEAFPVAAASP